jgi:hypothetical protein
VEKRIPCGNDNKKGRSGGEGFGQDDEMRMARVDGPVAGAASPQWPCSSRYFSASRAAMQPEPAAVMAWR